MATVNSISNTTSSAYDTAATSVVPQKTLNQEDFFKLLIAQMTSQDPMKPMSNAEFMGQMAQFSTLEQSKTLGAEVSKLRSQQDVFSANSLIGRDVTLKTGAGTVQGTVSGVDIQQGTPTLVVNGGTYELSQVLTIAPPAAAH